MNLQPNMMGPYGQWAASQIPEVPELALRNPDVVDVDRARVVAREKLRELLAPPPVSGIPAATVLSTTVHDGVAVERLEWPMPYGPPCRAVVLKPENARGRLPAVLGLHAHGGNYYFGSEKETQTTNTVHPMIRTAWDAKYGARAWTNTLAKRGYVVLMHDVFFFSSRRITGSSFPRGMANHMLRFHSELSGKLSGADARCADPSVQPDAEEVKRYNDFAALLELTLPKSILSAGLTWPGICLSDDELALNYLCSRPDVDPERIGAMGHSGGGIRMTYLAGLNDRIRVAVCSGYMTTWRDFVLNRAEPATWMIYVPHLSRYLDIPDILGLRAPLPTLVLHTKEDPLYTLAEAERAQAMLRETFEKAESPLADGEHPAEPTSARKPPRFRMSFYPGGHKLDEAIQDEAFDFFDGWLRKS